MGCHHHGNARRGTDIASSSRNHCGQDEIKNWRQDRADPPRRKNEIVDEATASPGHFFKKERSTPYADFKNAVSLSWSFQIEMRPSLASDLRVLLTVPWAVDLRDLFRCRILPVFMQHGRDS